MKTIIFDMYGVIIKHPEGGLMPFVNQYFPQLDESGVYPHWIKANKGELSSLDFFRNIGFNNDLEMVEKEYLNTIEIDEDFYTAASFLNKKYRLALLSNDLSEWSIFLREKFQINNYFDVIVISGDVKIAKPDSCIFELTLERLACPAQDCIYVDDRRKNLAAASLLGIDTILFNSRGVDYNGKIVKNFKELVHLLM